MEIPNEWSKMSEILTIDVWYLVYSDRITILENIVKKVMIHVLKNFTFIFRYLAQNFLSISKFLLNNFFHLFSHSQLIKYFFLANSSQDTWEIKMNIFSVIIICLTLSITTVFAGPKNFTYKCSKINVFERGKSKYYFIFQYFFCILLSALNFF